MVSSTGGEFRGKTVEEAIEAGLETLGLKPNQADVEILNRGSRGLLGFGAEEARVRITPLPAVQRRLRRRNRCADPSLLARLPRPCPKRAQSPAANHRSSADC